MCTFHTLCGTVGVSGWEALDGTGGSGRRLHSGGQARRVSSAGIGGDGGGVMLQGLGGVAVRYGRASSSQRGDSVVRGMRSDSHSRCIVMCTEDGRDSARARAGGGGAVERLSSRTLGIGILIWGSCRVRSGRVVLGVAVSGCCRLRLAVGRI